jgi:hypothetical protein
MKAWLFLLLLASCGFPALPEHGTDASSDAPSATPDQLFAIEPAIANTGDTITLEGTFAEPTMIGFPGGATVQATIIGPHRATAIVPAAASTGGLVAMSGGSTAPVAFRRASFGLGLQPFQQFDDQTNGARAMPSLVAGRRYAMTVVAKSSIYVVGGTDATGGRSDVERAVIAADGSVGPFATVVGSSLTMPRYYAEAVVIGNYLYAVGGMTTGDVEIDSTHSIERASINADGSLGAFETIPNGLVTPRHLAQIAVIGDSLYVAGGTTSTTAGSTVASIEHAAIAPDGSLGTFTADTDALATARASAASIVTGSSWFVLGGIDVSGDALASIESAPINGDGTLGAFAPVSATLVTPVFGAAAWQLGATITIAGGNSSGVVSAVQSASFAADGSLGAFANVAALPIPVAYAGAAVAGNGAYVIGGANDTSPALAGVLRASIDGDGMLDATVVNTQAFVTPRTYYPSVMVGGAYYALGGFAANQAGLASIEQASIAPDGTLGAFAAASATLATPMWRHPAAVIGNTVYIVGGTVANSAVTTVESAQVGSDGTLGSFTTVSGVALAVPRESHNLAIAGNHVYAIGGFDVTIDQASIGSDGTLGTFATVSSVGLTTYHPDASVVVLGNYLYVLGGDDDEEHDPIATIERIALAADGSLSGNFEQTGSFVNARNFPRLAVLGGYLYAMGGDANGTIERASIAADGTLGTFAVVAGTASWCFAGGIADNAAIECGGTGCTQMALP